MRARIDTDICVGSAFCARIAPNVFALNEKGRGVERDGGDVPSGEEDAAREAEAACPAAAIRVED